MDRPVILIVDDEPLNLTVLTRLLSPEFRVLGTRSGSAALALAARETPDLILLDVMMPELDGHAVLARLKADARTAQVPVIFVTALGTEVDEERGLAEGAVDYIVKPVKPAVVLARVRTQLELKAARDRLARQNSWLEQEVHRRVDEALLASDLTLWTLAEMAEARDSDTGNHILRTQAYVLALGRALQDDPQRADALDDAQLLRIVHAAPLHDIGKIGIPDHILLKPGRLDDAQLRIMRTHAALGASVIERALAKASALHPDPAQGPAPEPLRRLQTASTIARHHHERWDGSGYPDGLAGEAIPLAARLMAVADVYDAVACRRVYKQAWSLADTAALIESESGRHFDPRVVAAFTRVRGQFEALFAQLGDGGPHGA